MVQPGRVLQINETIQVENISSVYSGKPGCCCGCLGKHTYRKATQVSGGEKRGYPVGDDEVNDTVVAQHVRTINKAIASGRLVLDEGTHVFFDAGSRWYIAYR